MASEVTADPHPSAEGHGGLHFTKKKKDLCQSLPPKRDKLQQVFTEHLLCSMHFARHWEGRV